MDLIFQFFLLGLFKQEKEEKKTEKRMEQQRIKKNNEKNKKQQRITKKIYVIYNILIKILCY